MIKNKIFIYFLLALPFLMTSCLKNQDDLFEESAAARSSQYLNNVQRVLTSADNGWVLDYFPNRNQIYGGYSYTLKFDEQNVKACWELADDVTESITTTYAIDNEDGPVITFDTYNDYLHFFATPTGSSSTAGGYQGYDGDFILIVTNISDDENTITLKGNRSGNIMYMHRLAESIEDYQLQLASFKESMVFDQALGTIGGKQYKLNINANDRQLTIEPVQATAAAEGEGVEESVSADEEEEAIEAAFCFDKDGISLYEPVTINGHEVRVFKYDSDAAAFTAQEDNSVVFSGLLTPSIVINSVGENIVINNRAATLTYTFYLADKFTYTTDVDWITVNAVDRTLTITVAENTVGLERTGIITVEVDGQTATISVSQVGLNGMFVNAEGYVALSNISDAAQPYFLACKDLSDSESENIGEMVFVNIGGDYGYGLFFTSGNYGGLLGLDTQMIGGNQIKFTYNGSRNYSSGTWYYNYGYNTLINYLASTTFTITVDDEDEPTYFILTDDNDLSKYFKLTTTPVANPFAN